MYQKLTPHLIDLIGNNVPFSATARYSKITDQKLFVNSVLHKTFIDLNEESIESSDDTLRESTKYEEFVCNRPFLFLIHDNGFENVFFMDKYFKPL